MSANQKGFKISLKNPQNLHIDFVVRTGMFVQPINEHTILSFLYGYEMGTKGKYQFTRMLKDILEKKYRIAWGSRGLPEQIEKLAKKRKDTWVLTFKKVAMEVLTFDGAGVHAKMKMYLKYIVDIQVEAYERNGKQTPNKLWIEQWLTFVFLKYPWAKELWTVEEWKNIRQIDKQIQQEYSSKAK